MIRTHNMSTRAGLGMVKGSTQKSLTYTVPWRHKKAELDRGALALQELVRNRLHPVHHHSVPADQVSYRRDMPPGQDQKVLLGCFLLRTERHDQVVLKHELLLLRLRGVLAEYAALHGSVNIPLHPAKSDRLIRGRVSLEPVYDRLGYAHCESCTQPISRVCSTA